MRTILGQAVACAMTILVAKNPAVGQQFIDYATQQGTFPIWWSRGVDRGEGGSERLWRIFSGGTGGFWLLKGYMEG